MVASTIESRLVISAENRTHAGLSAVDRDVRQLTSRWSQAGVQASAAIGAAVAAAASSIAVFGNRASDQFEQYQFLINSTGRMIQNMGVEHKITNDAILENVRRLSRELRILPEDLQKAYRSFITLGITSEEQMESLIRTAADYEAVHGGGIENIIRSYGRLISTGRGAQRLFMQAGIEMTKRDEQVLAYLAATNRGVEAVEYVNQRLASTFRGQREELINVQGAALRFRVALWNLTTTFGRDFNPTANKATDFISGLMETMDDMPSRVRAGVAATSLLIGAGAGAKIGAAALGAGAAVVGGAGLAGIAGVSTAAILAAMGLTHLYGILRGGTPEIRSSAAEFDNLAQKEPTWIRGFIEDFEKFSGLDITTPIQRLNAEIAALDVAAQGVAASIGQWFRDLEHPEWIKSLADEIDAIPTPQWIIDVGERLKEIKSVADEIDEAFTNWLRFSVPAWITNSLSSLRDMARIVAQTRDRPDLEGPSWERYGRNPQRRMIQPFGMPPQTPDQPLMPMVPPDIQLQSGRVRSPQLLNRELLDTTDRARDFGIELKLTTEELRKLREDFDGSGGGGGGGRGGGGYGGGFSEAPRLQPGDTLRHRRQGAPSVSRAPTQTPDLGGGDFSEKAPKIMEALKRDLGLTQEQAAGVLGNLGAETGGFKHMQEIRPLIPGSRGGYGWAQWTGPRRRAFEKWSAEQGLEPHSDEANYGFLVHELQTTERRSLERLRQTRTAEEAAVSFMRNFERPGIPHTSSRVRWANRALNAFESRPPPAQESQAPPRGAAATARPPDEAAITRRVETSMADKFASDRMKVELGSGVIDVNIHTDSNGQVVRADAESEGQLKLNVGKDTVGNFFSRPGDPQLRQ